MLELASEMKLLKLGTVALDGTKLHANASRHSALSHGHITTLETQLKAEVQELLALAEAADQSDIPDGMNLPEEIKRREDRLAVMDAARTKIAARAKVRFDAEQVAYEEKLAKRAARTAETGRKPTGKPPQPPSAAPRAEDQINLMALGQPPDQDSRIMKVAGGGFDQCYNAQAAVATESMLVVVPALTQAASDKQQVEPMLERIAALPASLGKVESLLADTGYCSANNIAACEQAGINPHIAVAREDHHPGWRERFTEPMPLEANATPMQMMAHTLKTQAGKKQYALRKQTVEPVFGIMAQGHPVSHGATGKGNDQVRFELGYYALEPNIRVIAPWREWDLTSREKLLKYAEKAGIAVDYKKKKGGGAPYSMDANLLHISYEGGVLEDPNFEPEDSMWRITVSPEKAPAKPEYVELEYKKGDIVAVNGKTMTPAQVLTELNRLGGKHGIGRMDIVENRYVGMKSRGCYETPGGTIMLRAHRAMESITLDREVLALKDDLMPRYARLIYNGYWWSPERKLLQVLIDTSQQPVNGTVRLKLYKGTVMTVGRSSKKDSLFDPAISTFEEDKGAYNQADAAGFIKLNALRMRIAAKLNRK